MTGDLFDLKRGIARPTVRAAAAAAVARDAAAAAALCCYGISKAAREPPPVDLRGGGQVVDATPPRHLPPGQVDDVYTVEPNRG